MSIPRDRELVSIYTQANDIARQSGRSLSTAHMLLALFTVPNRAAVFLEDRSIAIDTLLRNVRGLTPEPDELVDRVNARSERIAKGSQASAVDSLHLLSALIRESSSQAHQLLDRSEVNVSAVRASLMSYATGSRALPRVSSRQRHDAAETSVFVTAVANALAREHAPSPIGIHPSLGGGAAAPGESHLDEDSEPAIVETEKPKWRPADPPANPQGEAIRDARHTAKNLAAGLFKKRQELLEKQKRAAQMEAACPELPSKPEPFKKEQPLRAPDSTSQGEALAEKNAGVQEADAPSPTLPPTPVAPARMAEHTTSLEPDVDLARAYALDADDYPNLNKFGRNLTEEAALGRLDKVLGRDAEILQLIDVLGKRRSNNPLLVGDAGVGKTAIVEGLANEFVKLARNGSRLGKRAIVELEVGRILGGTHLRGSFSERLIAIKDEVRRAGGDVIVFLDEIHGWLNAGSGGDGGDAAGELKTALARGQFPCIGATTADEFRSFVEADPAFERRFEVVLVDEPDEETTTQILGGIRGHYEDHHGARYTDEAIRAAVRLSQRFIHERRLPDKAVGVLDLAGSRASREGADVIDTAEIATIVAELAGLPPERLTETDRERFIQMEQHLGKRIIGHTDVVHSVCEVIRRNYAGFRSKRPIGSLLFLGPTGVGKTELVKALADFLFYDADAIVRFDMSEFMEAHSVSRLIGAPPGYVGFERGGQLTEVVRRRPYQVVLLDEIEKAHPDVLNVLLQLLDEGRLTDGRGRHVDFSNAVIVMTSNLGADVFDRGGSGGRSARIGFGESADSSPDDGLRTSVLDSARGHFPPELWNRIDERLVFLPLKRPEIARIAGLQLADTARRLEEERGIGLVFSEAVIRYLVDNGGFDPALGARPMRQTIQREVEGSVAKMILCGEATSGDKIYVRVEDDQLAFSAAEN